MIKFKDIHQSDLIIDYSISPEDYPIEDFFAGEDKEIKTLKEEVKHNMYAWCKMTIKGTLRDNHKFFCVREVRYQSAYSYEDLMNRCYEENSFYQMAISDIIFDIEDQMVNMFLFLTGRIEKQG